MQSFKGYRAVTIASNIKKDTAFVIYQKLNDLPGIDVREEPIRYYPYNNLASSSIGYLSSIDGSKEANYELRGYDVSSDLIGVAGIESSFEDQLKGVKGGTTVKVNSKGRVTEELFKLDSYPGNNVHLTINKDVQYAAEQAMKDTMERIKGSAPNATRGSVVAIEVNTGRVIAMVSYPDYDPNIFSIPGRLTEDLSKQYFSPDIDSFAKEYMKRTGATGNIDELFPIDENTGKRKDGIDVYPKSFFNYATQGSLPPGSVFKPLTAVAGLMEGVVTTGEPMNDTSGTWSKDDLPEVRRNFQGVANGATDLRKALQVSSNYYFYELGYRLYKQNGGDINNGNVEALDSLAKYAWKFGLGVDPDSPEAENPSTGIQLQEDFGQVYNFYSWKKKMVDLPMFEIVDALKVGNYYRYSFVPLNIEDNENDSDELREAKTALKSQMKDTLSKVGTDEEISDNTKYAESLLPYIKKIMDLSPQYKNAVLEASKKRSVDIDEEAGVISDAIAYYIINNMRIQILTPGQIVSSAIGQGMNNFTPVQLANYVATLGSGGTRYKVSIVDKVTSPTGEVIKEYKPEVVDKLDIPEDYLQAIKDGMYKVNTSPSNGTAYKSFNNFPIKVGGKTGTADFSTDEQYVIQGRLAYGNYISMAPLDNPQIAIFSTIYDGGKGSEGATIHKAIYEAFFKDELLKLDPSYASKSQSFKKYVVDSPLKDNKNDSIKLDNGITNNSSSNTNNQ
jgi:penicillin-binding protein 2